MSDEPTSENEVESAMLGALTRHGAPLAALVAFFLLASSGGAAAYIGAAPLSDMDALDGRMALLESTTQQLQEDQEEHNQAIEDDLDAIEERMRTLETGQAVTIGVLRAVYADRLPPALLVP